MRCGNKLVQAGDDMVTVKALCGAPAAVEHGVQEQGQAEVTVETWTYDRGSNQFLVRVRFVDGKVAWIKALREIRKSPRDLKKLFWLKGWAEQTIIVLVMQSFDNSLTVSRKTGWFGGPLVSRQGQVEPNPTVVVTFNSPRGRSLLSVSTASAMASLANTSCAVR